MIRLIIRNAICLIAGVALLVPLQQARADFLNLQPGAALGKDNQLVSGLANTNLGTSVFVMDNWAGNFRSISLVEFDLSGLPSGATIVSATFSLFHRFNSNLNARYDLFRVTSAWDEMTSTYNSAPTYDATAVSTLTIPDGGVDVFRSWNVTSLVQGWASNTFANFGMWIEEIPVQGSSSAYFSSSDETTAAWRPKISIEYIQEVPAPAGVILAGFGFVGVYFLRSRFRRPGAAI